LELTCDQKIEKKLLSVRVKFLGCRCLRKTVHLLLVGLQASSRFLPNEPKAGVQAELAVQVQNLYFDGLRRGCLKSCTLEVPKENFGCFWVQWWWKIDATEITGGLTPQSGQIRILHPWLCLQNPDHQLVMPTVGGYSLWAGRGKAVTSPNTPAEKKLWQQ